MHYHFIDRVLEQGAERIVTLKLVTSAEEYLRDHFPGYPVLPGVFMLESMVHAARRLEGGERDARLCIAEVRALKYGSFVRPGSALRVEVERTGSLAFKGRAFAVPPEEPSSPVAACSGRFTLRPPAPA